MLPSCHKNIEIHYLQWVIYRLDSYSKLIKSSYHVGWTNVLCRWTQFFLSHNFYYIVEVQIFQNRVFYAPFRNRLKLVPELNMTLSYTKLPGGNWFGLLETSYSHFIGILRSNTLYAKNTKFYSCSNAKMSDTNEKSWKNWSRNWYGSIYLDVWFTRYGGLKIRKKDKKCWVSIFFWFSKIDISRTVHPYILNHTIFLIIFSSSFHWCHSFLHLSNYKFRYFLRIRCLTREYQENGCKLSPIAQINSLQAVLCSW